MPAPADFLNFVDANADAFIERLKDGVAIRSVSGDPALRQEVIDMGNWVNGKLQDVGVETKQVDIGTQTLKNKTSIPLPPVIVGRLGNDSTKKTVLVYAHFDVMPANKADGWNTDPWVLTPVTTDTSIQLVGRGSTDDKGNVLGWINVLQYYSDNKIALPVNFRCVFEGMEESGSVGFDGVVKAETQPGGWLTDVDCVCITDNYWLYNTKPAVTYGVRGISYFGITIIGPSKGLHSGIFGRMVHEPMTDLIILMSKLVATDGTILIPGIEEMVPPPTSEDHAEYELYDYTIADLDATVGAHIGLSDDKAVVLMGKMRYPSLSLHGIMGAYSGDALETIIPAQVTGKFSIRLVPPQTPDNVNPIVIQFIKDEFAKLNTKTTLDVQSLGGANPWLANPNDWNFTAARTATKEIYNVDAELTREGGSIGATLVFSQYLGPNVSVTLLPMGRGDDGAHSINEKLDRSNFIEGTKLFGTYLYEISSSSH